MTFANSDSTTESPAGSGDRALNSTGARFDVRGFARTAQGNHRETLRLDEFSTDPLSADSIRSVRYLARLESGTMEQLRNLLVTATHKDARITAFLVTWAFEKFWIADALDAVLEANGQPKSHDAAEGSVRRSHTESVERRGPIRRAIAGLIQGVPIIGVHVTTGLVDEWVTRAAYDRLDASSQSSALSATIATIVAVKERHVSFFDDEARRRLADDPKAVALTRTSLERQAWPLGAIDRAGEDRSFFEKSVFGDDTGRERAADIGRRVAGLPGMDSRIGDAVTRKLRE
ncbi:hypothetical protein [Lacisediminihabitans sp. H27-G8]|uniref:hypothetical protein n=1 Tax=Lacisediminihabitans sp. H27-G8 TaxID=3111909 RepID=UPI0038FD1CFD